VSPAGRSPLFFDRFRREQARLPAGLIRAMPPATPEAIARVEAALGGALPADYASFLRSFDGADLFHGAILVAGAGSSAPLSIVELNAGNGAPGGELAFAETPSGDRFALDGAGRVLRLRGGSEERTLAGSSFERWLDATVAKEQVLYGADGEFAAEAFEPDGEEVAPLIALRQAERALKVDPGAAEAAHERGIALRRLGRGRAAMEAFAAAAALDPENPWPWFDLGRAALDEGRDVARAFEAFRRAAALEAGPGGARLLVWAARAALAAHDEAGAAEARREALARDPALADGLGRAVSEAEAEGDERALAEAAALAEALSPLAGVPPRHRLPVIHADDHADHGPRRPPPERRRAGAKRPRSRR
jgi:hypothetical protein